MKLSIAIPEDHEPEIRYVVDVVFGDFLHLDYEVEVRPAITDVVLQYEGRRLIFQDHFFSRFLDGDTYVKEDSMPGKVGLLQHNAVRIPIVYGQDYFYRDERMIVCGLDLYASVFFLLTAWEEDARNYIIDEHGYFPFNASWLWKNGHAEHALILSYLELLKDLLAELGMNEDEIVLPETKGQLYVYVEDLQYFKSDYRAPSLKDYFTGFGRAQKEQQLWKSFQTTKRDPYNNLEAWADVFPDLVFVLSEKLNDKEQKGLIHQFQEENQSYGFTLSDPESLEHLQHDLLYCWERVPLTLQEKWRLLSELGAQQSLNAFFYHYYGYRVGTVVPFRTFDVMQRKPHGLIEIPLHKYGGNSTEDFDAQALQEAICKGQKLMFSNTLLI